MSRDAGFDLQRIELNNWGNFQGWQYAHVSRPPSVSHDKKGHINALLVGINGAGKSTIIDGVIVTLLPYEGALKLGVTHDLEKGSAGGRDVESYVLGKFGSTGGRSDFEPKDVYSREA